MDKKTELNSIKLIIITIGSTLLLVGLIFLIEFKLHTRYMFILIPLIICSFVFFLGWKLQKKFLLAAGSLLFFIVFSSLFVISNLSLREIFGIISFLLSFVLAIYFVFAYLIFKKVVFWLFNPIIVFLFLGIVFIKGNYTFLHFTFYIGLAIGIALFGSGLYWRLFGLIIPGCLLIGISPGLFFAWGNSNLDNGLVQTGIFLVCFALGWGLITVFSRMQTQNFLWWPLIPGGILAMVGWGLYIGGNPKNAVGFIGNTGSIGLLIFGIYILLMKRGIQR